jgi:dihydroceramidase
MVSASNNDLSHPGYWDFLPKASIDFCEPNYTHNFYIAELFNTLSSLFIAYIGVAGLAHAYTRNVCSSCRYEKYCYYSLYSNALCIGLGSCALHATLSTVGQASDEIPMVLANVFVLAFLVEHKSPPNHLKYPLMPLFCVLGVVFCVFWYLTFQDNYFAFLALYISGVATIIFWFIYLVFFTRSDPWEEKQRSEKLVFCFTAAMSCYVLLGFGAWIMDMIMCDYILKSYTFLQIFLHPVWHIGAGIGTHLAVCLGTSIRCTALHKEFKWTFFMFLPFVEAVEDNVNDVALLGDAVLLLGSEKKVTRRGRSKTPVRKPASANKETEEPSSKKKRTPSKTPATKKKSSKSKNSFTPVRGIDSPGLIKCRDCGKACAKGNYGFCKNCRPSGQLRGRDGSESKKKN